MSTKLKLDKILDFSNRIEGHLSGKSIEKRFSENYEHRISAKELFELNRKNNKKQNYLLINIKKIFQEAWY